MFRVGTGHRAEGLDPADRRAELSQFFLLVLSVLTLVYGLLNLLIFNYVHLAGVQFAVFLVVVAALIDLRVCGNVERSAWLTVFAFGVLGVYFFWYIQGAFSAAVWMVMFAVICFFLLGSRKGWLAYLVFCTAVVLLILLYRDSWPAVQSGEALSNILGALAAFGLISAYQERSRENAYARIREMADTDFLTGVSNRRHFVERFARARDRRSGTPGDCALLLVDIDEFKRVNDSYGHIAGDEVIATLCARIGSVVRDGDVVGRLGGEEFGVLLPDCNFADARRRADAIRERVERETFSAGEALVRVTVSIGVAVGDPAVDDFTTLFSRADGNLYEAKSQGRNRVVADAQ